MLRRFIPRLAKIASMKHYFLLGHFIFIDDDIAFRYDLPPAADADSCHGQAKRHIITLNYIYLTASFMHYFSFL